MRRPNRRNTILGSIIFAIVGLIMVIAAIVLSGNEQRFISTAIHITGTVADLVSSSDSKGNISYRPVVKFTTVEGRAISYTSNISSNPSGYSVGQKVDIYYDPANPTSVVIAGQTGPIYLIVGGMGALFALLGIGAVALRIIRGR